MCCPGCEAVAQAIVDSGFSDNYRSRTSYANTADAGGALVPPELRLFDAEEEQQRYATVGDDNLREAVFSVEGIRCAACVWLIERRLARLPGVAQAGMNVATERLHLRWDPARCKPSDVLQSMRQVGYTAYPFDPVRQGAQLQKAGRKLFRQLFVAGLSMMQVMMYAVPVYLATDGTMDADMETMMRWASLLLTVPAVVYSAQPFFAGAWASLRSRSPGMDVPVALGIGAAFIGSVAATLRGHGDVYFDSVTMFIFLLLCSRYLEVIARRRAATALERLQHALPASATRLAGYPGNVADEVVGAAQLQAGDVIRVRPGEAFAVDGVLIDGETSVDLSLLTGESRPQHKRSGEAIPGGAINASQPVLLRVSRAVAESTLSTLVKLIERAGQGKPQLALWADKVAGWFVIALLILAVTVFAVWWLIDPSRAWPIAIAVLVVSCPCALSLATPSALAAATDALLRQGVLVIQPHVLETLHRATHIVFDKTGTLTEGRPVLQSCDLLDGAAKPERPDGTDNARRDHALQLAAALEASSLHPLARAFTQAASSLPPLTAQAAGSVAGEGLWGAIDGTTYRIGRHDFVAALVGLPLAQPGSDDGASTVYLGRAGAWIARFALSDALRPEAAEVVAYFRRAGKEVRLLSGDRQQTVDRIAAQLGIANAFGAQLPDQKLAHVQALQAQGAVVAMVGDGINDAAVLKAADVSFAMGSGAALAQTHADTVLLSGRLDAVSCAARTAGRTMAVVRQNLWWASVYNLVAIPAAALGWLNPWMAGVGMSLSSAIVVANALRLSRIAHRRQ
ncbi:heavy metal translocating P-type ATPase [Lacisediminimonas sp.]|uniref:heavy metal translocating P-type ATPase n=1 Tax=Lacisediminimonas sp. TaxID=3060582 RepID=UPI0027212581|nr:heavy metal translocating P-type ATPase [Lacisediminimonas sp.]MDO8300389.1 heavy metal translocating P-type ATPase [Lacisediminimonas sp.]